METETETETITETITENINENINGNIIENVNRKLLNIDNKYRRKIWTLKS